MSLIIDNLYIGSFENINDIKKNNISGIVYIISESYKINKEHHLIEKHYYDLDNNVIDEWIFEDIYQLIQSFNNRQKNILVVCDHGIYHSSAIALYYIMKKYNCGINNATGFLKRRRPSIRFYKNYIKLLST